MSVRVLLGDARLRFVALDVPKPVTAEAVLVAAGVDPAAYSLVRWRGYSLGPALEGKAGYVCDPSDGAEPVRLLAVTGTGGASMFRFEGCRLRWPFATVDSGLLYSMAERMVPFPADRVLRAHRPDGSVAAVPEEGPVPVADVVFAVTMVGSADWHEGDGRGRLVAVLAELALHANLQVSRRASGLANVVERSLVRGPTGLSDRGLERERSLLQALRGAMRSAACSDGQLDEYEEALERKLAAR